MALNGPSESLPATSIGIHQELWGVSGQISELLTWSAAVAIWLVSLPVIFLASVFLPQLHEFVLADLVVGGGVFLVTGAVSVLQTLRAKRIIDQWEDRMLPFFYMVNFELLPFTETSREQDIWKRFQSLYPALAEDRRKRIGMFRRAPGPLFNAEVKGRKSKHAFSVASTDDDLVLLARRFHQSTPVGVDELVTLRDEAADVIKRLQPTNHVVAAFSDSGFTSAAIEYARSDQSYVRGVPVDLIAETDTGYRVVAVVTE